MAVPSNPLAQALVDLEVQGVTGVLRIDLGDDVRTVELVHGRLAVPRPDACTQLLYVHGLDVEDGVAAAVAGTDRLADRLAEAMAGRDATWTFEPGPAGDASTTPTSVVVRDARRRLAERERLSIQVPLDTGAPTRVFGAETRGVHLSRLLGNVYAAIDGERTVEDLAGALGLDAIDVRRATFRLSSLGLVDLDRRTTTAARTNAVPTHDWAADQLADAIEGPEPWIGYAQGGDAPAPIPAPPPPRSNRFRTPISRREEEAPSAGSDTAEGQPSEDAPPTRRTEPQARTRRPDPEERRESLREAAAWLAAIDHEDGSGTDASVPDGDGPQGPGDDAEPDRAGTDEARETSSTSDDARTATGDETPGTPAAPQDVASFLRELSQLSRDE